MRNAIGKLMMVPYIFVLMNWAPVAGIYHFARGRRLGIWNRPPLGIRRRNV